MKPSPVYLKPGELCYSEIPARVFTILGSCVAVTMFDPGTKVGSICDAMLPRGPSSPEEKVFRYVDYRRCIGDRHWDDFKVR